VNGSHKKYGIRVWSSNGLRNRADERISLSNHDDRTDEHFLLSPSNRLVAAAAASVARRRSSSLVVRRRRRRRWTVFTGNGARKNIREGNDKFIRRGPSHRVARFRKLIQYVTFLYLTTGRGHRRLSDFFHLLFIQCSCKTCFEVFFTRNVCLYEIILSFRIKK